MVSNIVSNIATVDVSNEAKPNAQNQVDSASLVGVNPRRQRRVANRQQQLSQSSSIIKKQNEEYEQTLADAQQTSNVDPTYAESATIFDIEMELLRMQAKTKELYERRKQIEESRKQRGIHTHLNLSNRGRYHWPNNFPVFNFNAIDGRIRGNVLGSGRSSMSQAQNATNNSNNNNNNSNENTISST